MVIRPSRSLRMLLPLMTALLALLGGATILTVELEQVPGHVTAELIRDAEEIATPLQGNLNRFYRLGDGEGIDANLAWTGTHPQSLGAAVLDEEGKVIAGTRIQWRGHLATEVLPLALRPAPGQRGPNAVAVAVSDVDPTAVVARFPVRLGSSASGSIREGTLVMGFDITRPLAQAQRAAWLRFCWFTLAMTAIAGVLGLALNALVSNRARSLVRQARAIAGGDLLARTELLGKDELAALGRALNEMAERLLAISRERERAEAELKKTATLLSGVVNGTADSVFAKDLEGKYLLVNPAAAGFIGKAAQEILGKDDTAAFPPRDAAVLMATDRKVMASGETILTEEHITGGGVTRTYLAQKSPLLDEEGRLVGLIGISRDVTERVETERRYRMLSEMSPVAIFRADTRGRCLYVNPRWSALTGLPAERALKHGWTECIHPEDLPGVLANAKSRMDEASRAIARMSDENGAAPSLPPPLEYRIQRPDGTIRWALAQLAPEIDGDLSISGWVGTIMDITERKQAEADLAKAALDQKRSEAEIQALNADLERRVALRTEELQRSEAAFREQSGELAQANTALAKAARLKDEFLASMSHELRTPLNGVLSLAQALQEGVYGRLSDDQAAALRDIEQSGRHLLALINDILDLSKVEAGEVKLQPAPVDVRGLCTASMRMVKELAQKKKLRLSMNVDERATLIVADERRLKQILVNLLSNAVKFTPEQGAVEVGVVVDPEREVIRFAVRDTGIGIRREDMGLLFRPFQQIDSRLSREYAGTGLGLALVARLADLHGGSVSVESEPGAGSCFTVQIPWRPVDERDAVDPGRDWSAPFLRIPGGGDRPEGSAAPEAERSRGGRVLLVEDNELISRVLATYLRSTGYDVATAMDGIEAIQKARDLGPAAILMDIQMPRMDGLEATRRLKADPATSRIPIAALTALAMTGDRERCMEAGVDEYITKPIDLAVLLTVVERMLRGSVLAGSPGDHGDVLK